MLFRSGEHGGGVLARRRRPLDLPVPPVTLLGPEEAGQAPVPGGPAARGHRPVADYQGELKISLWNRSSETFIIEPMARVAQMVIVPVLQPQFKVVDEFAQSSRGEGGFGSTGRM